jgi:hypothetical protein
LTKFWDLNKIMTDVTAVNFVRLRELNHRELMAFLDVTEGPYGDTAYCCEVHWLRK